jgi:hypothetical protein
VKQIVWAATAALCLVGGASAQGLDEGTVVSGLVVRPGTPGPAWWRVSDADSAVYILILPNVSVTDRPWDRSVLERRVQGANVFILPFELSLADPRSIAGMGAVLAQTPKAFFGPKPKLQKKDPSRPPLLEDALTPDVRARFVALRTQIGQPAERYAAMSPLRAAGMLEHDYRASLKLTGGGDMFESAGEMRRIEAFAKRNKVRIEAAWKIVIPPVKLKIGATDEPAYDKQIACLDAAMTRIQARAQAERAAYLAWSEGDVRPLLKPIGFARDPGCVGASRSLSADTSSSPALRKAEENFVADQAKALERALKMPGRSVAVLEPLSPLGNVELGLLGKRGVLERMRAKGYEITAPNVLTDNDD